MNRKLAVILIVGPLLVMTALAADPGQNPPLQVKPQVELKKLPAFPPTITSAIGHRIVGGPSPQIQLTGRGFGEFGTSRRVLVDGLPAERQGVLEWTDKFIRFEAANFPFIGWYHQYTITIDDGAGKILSNQFKATFPIEWWSAACTRSATPGTEVVLYCYDAGADQGTKALRMGGVATEILRWTDHGRSGIEIRARVPAVPPGDYKIWMVDGANKISGDLNFQVR